jgi:curved DNA-binding protein CbpA
MSFNIERGLFLLDFVDHHAVLGVPVDADVKDIRKRYLKIARILHPDSFAFGNEPDKHFASQLLSKMVNPAWEKLSQEKERSEYEVLLKLKGQLGVQKKSSLEFGSNLAKQLLVANNVDHFYHTSLRDLATKQYEQLDQVLEITAQISELNLAYLMQKAGATATQEQPRKQFYTGSNIPDSTQAASTPAATPPRSAPAAPASRESFVDQYYRRAEGFVEKNNYAQAILELRDALKVEPNNSSCHALMGVIYLRQNKLPMAKIHLNKALEMDANNAMAKEGKQRLEQMQAGSGKSGTSAAQKANPKIDKSGGQSGGGLFGLFGGKKK